MSAYVLLNLLNELGKSDKMPGLPRKPEKKIIFCVFVPTLPKIFRPVTLKHH